MKPNGMTDSISNEKVANGHNRRGGISPPLSLSQSIGNGNDDTASSSTLVFFGGAYATPPPYLTAKDIDFSSSPSTPKQWEMNYQSYLSEHPCNGDKHQQQRDNEKDTALNCLPNLSLSTSMPQAPRGLPRHNEFLSEGDDSETDKSVRGGKMFKSLFGASRNKEGKNSSDSYSSKRYSYKKDRDDLDRSQTSNRSKSFGSISSQNIAHEGGVRRGVKLLEPKGTVIGPGGVVKTFNRNFDGEARQHDAERLRKIKFTELHNSSSFAKDSVSAYLGADKSSHYSLEELQENSDRCSPSNYTRLPSVTEEISVRILKPIEGVESWSKNEQYFMTPAIMAMCPEVTFSFVEGLETSYRNDATLSSKGTGTKLSFGKHLLGKATEVGSKNSSVSSVFVLRQNYLLEFENGGDLHSLPRGVAFLQDCLVEIVDDVIKLEYHEKPKTTHSKLRKILLHVEPKERKRWVSLLRAASNLNIEQLYEYDASESSTELGKGRYATVRPGRRRGLKKSTSIGPLSNKNNNGIMKRNPSFSSLSHAMQTNLIESECALKIVDKATFWDRVKKGKERADGIVREISVQATLTAHAGAQRFLRILSFVETFDKIVLELELLEGNDLFQYVSTTGALSELEAAHIIYNLLTCLVVMKKVGIAHRDLKPANIMISTTAGTDKIVKLGDFGMANFISTDNLVYGRCGTPGYVAPEIFLSGKNAGYENKVDIFSAGVTLYVLLCGYEPFYGESEKELIMDNKEAKVQYPDIDWEKVSVEGRDLVEKMLQRDPRNRIEAIDALRHPWITRRSIPSKINAEEYSLDSVACCIS